MKIFIYFLLIIECFEIDYHLANKTQLSELDSNVININMIGDT
jgi:hypothetical protein